MQPEPPANDGWQEIIHQPVAHHNGWPTISFPFPPPPPPFNPNSQDDRIASPTQSSHASKRLKTTMPEPEIDKGKKVANSPNSSENSSESVSSHLHLKDNFSHVIKVKSILKVPISLRLLQKEKQQKDQKRAVVKRGKPPLIENMVFNVVNAIFF
jgi:hypothetical protein